MYIGLHVKYRLLLSYFNEIWIFLKDLQKVLKHQISLKSAQGGGANCSILKDGRTNRHDVDNSRFSQLYEKRIKMGDKQNEDSQKQCMYYRMT